MPTPATDLSVLDRFGPLQSGGHDGAKDAMCVMEAVALIAAGPKRSRMDRTTKTKGAIYPLLPSIGSCGAPPAPPWPARRGANMTGIYDDRDPIRYGEIAPLSAEVQSRVDALLDRCEIQQATAVLEAHGRGEKRAQGEYVAVPGSGFNAPVNAGSVAEARLLLAMRAQRMAAE